MNELVERLRRIGDELDAYEYSEICAAADEIKRLRKIEAAAVKALDHMQWDGDDWYDDMWALVDALGGEVAVEKKLDR